MSTETTHEQKTLSKIEQALNIALIDDLKWINDQQWPYDEERAATNLTKRLNERLSNAGVSDYRVSVQRRPARIVVDQIS